MWPSVCKMMQFGTMTLKKIMKDAEDVIDDKFEIIGEGGDYGYKENGLFKTHQIK